MSIKANTGRDDLNARLDIHGLVAGEPTFIMEGRDQLVGDATRCYAALAYEAGCDVALVESALQQADAIDAWPHKKLPDLARMTPERAKQLRYAFSRRAWYAREDVADVRIAFAQERAVNALQGALASTLHQLLKHGAWTDGQWTYTPPEADGQDRPRPPCPIAALENLATFLRAEGAKARQGDASGR